MLLPVLFSFRRPRQDSNLRARLRRPLLYPLSYEGKTELVYHKRISRSNRSGRVRFLHTHSNRAVKCLRAGAS